MRTRIPFCVRLSVLVLFILPFPASQAEDSSDIINTVPKGSNSGIYVMGECEIQILEIPKLEGGHRNLAPVVQYR